MGLSPSCMSGNAVQGSTKRMKIKSSPSATGVKSKWQSLELVSSNDGAGSHLLHENCIVEANVECPVFSVAGFEVFIETIGFGVIIGILDELQSTGFQFQTYCPVTVVQLQDGRITFIRAKIQ